MYLKNNNLEKNSKTEEIAKYSFQYNTNKSKQLNNVSNFISIDHYTIFQRKGIKLASYLTKATLAVM